MIKIVNLSIETNKGRKLVENLSFTLNNGDKIAVIGEEGNGKSTLLKCIYDSNLVDDYCKCDGKIEKNNSIIGYLEQKLNRFWDDYIVFDYFLKSTPESDIDYSVYNQVNNLKKLFREYNLDISYLDNDKRICELSGGEKVKLQLIKLNFFDYDAFLMDEPTNDLDIETLELLEKFMIKVNRPILFVSHDETLLTNVSNQIIHIEQLIKKTKPKFTIFNGNYNEYKIQRERSILHQEQMAYAQRREKAKKEEVLRQIKQKVENALNSSKKDPSSGRIIAKKMANIKAQEKKQQEEELIEIPDTEDAINIIINQSITLPNRKQILNLNLDNLKVGDKVLSKNVELKIFGPRKIAIIGSNGAGKSTLLKVIKQELLNTPNIHVGYFSQNYSEVLNYNNSAINELSNNLENFNPRTLLGSLKFTREEMEHKIDDLSEGQKAKILLMKIIMDKSDVLLLDEPTRNLSPLSNPVIRGVLQKYNGCIIAVSHDRKFIDEIFDEIYELNEFGLKKKEKIKIKNSDLNINNICEFSL